MKAKPSQPILASPESRNVIISHEEAPSASGVLPGSDFVTGFSVHETVVKQRKIATKKEFIKKVFADQVFNNSLNF